MAESVQSLRFVPRSNAETLTQRSLTPVIAFFVFSVFVSFWFFFDSRNADATALIGDQANILAVCAKKDFPHLLNHDQVVADVRNTAFYTPLFVDVLRALSRPKGNYLYGLNIMLLITSLLYFWGWWLLFSFWGNRWLAGVMAFLVRGIMYPPGYELWGIAGLWTMLPRTLFLALVPFVLWAWLKWRTDRRAWIFIIFFTGLLANVHPISGFSVTLALLSADAIWTFLDSKQFKHVLLRTTLGGIAALIGMFPFIWTYISTVPISTDVSGAELGEALRLRIAPFFWDPFLYAKLWLRPKWIILALLPWVACLLIPRRLWKSYRKPLAAFAMFAVACVLTATVPFLIEAALKKAGWNVRFAFQMVRTGKYVMIPTILVTSLLLSLAVQFLTERYRYGSRVVALTLIIVMGLSLFSQHRVFNSVPFLGDDVVRFLWPGSLAITDEQEDDLKDSQDQKMNGVLQWIRNNTDPEAKFVGPRAITSFGLRSVIHDWKGAVLLIEGNPAAFVKAANMEKTLRQAEYKDPVRRSDLFAQWGADFWVTRWYTPELPVAYYEQTWFVYDLRSRRQSNSIQPLN